MDVALRSGAGYALDTHYRSAPHLIGFSATHFYKDALVLASQHPNNHNLDAIDYHVVDGKRGTDGANPDEAEAIIAFIRQLGDRTHVAKPVESIGIVTPFRAQADLLLERCSDEFTPEELEGLGRKVGTVHAFQGAEFDLVCMSWVVDR